MTESDAIIQVKKTKKSISGKSSQKMKWSDEMLTEERLQGIERIVKEKGSASIPELMERMGISESTARRDLTLLDKQGRLQKVRGGAMIISDVYSTKEDTVLQKKDRNLEEKVEIAKYAASLIEPDDFVFIDAGTTTAYMIDYITQRNATYVTNAVLHARRLAAAGFRVFLTGGELKGSTEALIGTEAVGALQRYHFVKGFFGVNGITLKCGFTTPDIHEASVKKAAVAQCRKCYILADSEKFNRVSPVTFAPFYGAKIITDSIPMEYAEYKNIVKCG